MERKHPKFTFLFSYLVCIFKGFFSSTKTILFISPIYTVQKVVNKTKIIEICFTSNYNFSFYTSKSSFFVIVKCDPGPQKKKGNFLKCVVCYDRTIFGSDTTI